MVVAGAAGDAVGMRDWTKIGPGDLTRDRYDRLLTERLHRKLTLLTMIRRPEISARVCDARREGEHLPHNTELVDALEDEAQLERRIMLLHLAWSRQRAEQG
jgi:transcription elongation factor-like protein